MQYYPYTRYFFVQKKDYGFTGIGPTVHFEQLLPPESLTFVCQECGEQWGVFPVRHSQTGKLSRFRVYNLLCEKCCTEVHFNHVPGTVHLSWDKPFNDSIPEELLRRELQLYLNTYPESST